MDGKLILRRSTRPDSDWARPYVLVSDGQGDVNELMLEGLSRGDVVILPVECHYVFGIGDGQKYTLQRPIGLVRPGEDLTAKVYARLVEFGRGEVADSGVEFVDETNGPRRITVQTLSPQALEIVRPFAQSRTWF